MITPERDRELRLAAIPRAIRGAGFVPGEMRLRARGSYEHHAGAPAFRVRGWQSLLRVERASSELPDGELELTARVDYSRGEIAIVAEALQRRP